MIPVWLELHSLEQDPFVAVASRHSRTLVVVSSALSFFAVDSGLWSKNKKDDRLMVNKRLSSHPVGIAESRLGAYSEGGPIIRSGSTDHRDSAFVRRLGVVSSWSSIALPPRVLLLPRS